MSANSLGARADLPTAGGTLEIFRLDALGDDVDRLSYSMKVLLENLLRHDDGATVTADDLAALAAWPGGGAKREISFMPARMLMQDFTGVLAVLDLAAMRDAVEALGGDPGSVNPLIRTDLVIDHSVSVEAFASPDAFRRNVEIELERNAERYRFLKWGQQASVGSGWCRRGPDLSSGQPRAPRQGRLCRRRHRPAYRDSLVRTDSHTPMVNGLGSWVGVSGASK